MSSNWYYVLNGQRQGPVSLEEVKGLYSDGSLNEQDYVWYKGLENWVKIEDAPEFQESSNEIPVEPEISIPEPISFSFSDRSSTDKIYYIKVGADRGQEEVEYGPFNVDTLVKLYKENRVNAKTFLFTSGMANWSLLSEFSDFASVFDDAPPEIKEEDKRAFKRKPFIARMFIQNDQKVYEGICRDVSIGGMQVLIDSFPGSIGDAIDINVHPETLEHSFVASGKIVRVLEGGQGFSFRFHNLNDEALSAISSYISE